MPAWIARRAAPAIWKRIPWKMVWTVVVWLGNKGRERIDDNLTQKEQSEFWRLLKKSKGRPEHAPPARPHADQEHRRQSDPRRLTRFGARAPSGYRPDVASDLRLSVLDQTPVSEGSTAAQALRNSIDLAELAERLGYHRYWVAEHHGGGLVAGPSPEVLIGPIAAATSRLRVGSGGVMLPALQPAQGGGELRRPRRPLPGRIDLGIGRAAGTDPMTTHALQRDRAHALPDDFPDQLDGAARLLRARLPRRPPGPARRDPAR